VAPVAGGGFPRRVCEDILWLLDWSADGLIYARGRPGSVAVLNLTSGVSKDLLN
jgi:hypothetical protein